MTGPFFMGEDQWIRYFGSWKRGNGEADPEVPNSGASRMLDIPP